MQAAPASVSRDELLSEIAVLETRLAELRASLPPAIKRFYRFRCKPERFVWVYADSRGQAEARLHERMNASYGEAWAIVSTAVDEYDEPEQAAAHSPGNLLRSIPVEQAREFVSDWRANQAGRVEKSRLENVTRSQLETDVLDFERWERQRKG